MTYCCFASCPDTGRVGIAIASRSIACGFSHVHVVPRVGALVRVGPRELHAKCTLLNMLALGFSPAMALERGGSDVRENASMIALMGHDAKYATWMAEGAAPWSGSVSRSGALAFGIGLAGQHVADAMMEAYEGADRDDLDARLLRALEMGHAAGGLIEGNGTVAARSAALMIYGRGVHSEVDLRVDLHDDAVGQLRALFDFHKPYEAFYLLRSDNPRSTPPQEAFMATIGPDAREVSP